VVGISGDSFAAEDQQFSQRAHILVLGRGDADLIRQGLGENFLFVIRSPCGAIGKRFRYGSGFSLHGIPNLQPFPDPVCEHIIAPCHISDCGKKRLADEMGGGPVHGSLFFQLLTVDGDAFAHIYEQILEICGLLGLAAHSPYRTPFILCCFLALKTKHITTSFVFFYFIAHLKI